MKNEKLLTKILQSKYIILSACKGIEKDIYNSLQL